MALFGKFLSFRNVNEKTLAIFRFARSICLFVCLLQWRIHNW